MSTSIVRRVNAIVNTAPYLGGHALFLEERMTASQRIEAILTNMERMSEALVECSEREAKLRASETELWQIKHSLSLLGGLMK